VRAVVLVGGQGTRLRPLTFSTPKPMLPVAEVSMIERVVAHLAGHGIDEVVLSMGYKPDEFVAAFPGGTCQGVRLSYAVEPEPLNTGGGIAFAARQAGVDDTFVVINGDVLTDLDLTELVAFHRDRGGEATIALTPVDDPTAFGVVPTDERGRVTAFLEPDDDVKKGRATAAAPPPTNLINAGYYVFEPAVIERMPADTNIHLETQVFPAMVAEGVLYALGSTAYWTDTGTPALYLQASLDYVRGKRGLPPVVGAKERAPGVWTLGASVIDGEVTAPALVGDAAYLATGCSVTESVVGGGARVEAGAVVRGSLLLPGAVVKAGALVEASIVGEGAVIGDEARVTDLTVVQGRATVSAGSALAGERVSA
jgi:NDP-sugar pyrophosphorylase family protein